MSDIVFFTVDVGEDEPPHVEPPAQLSISSARVRPRYSAALPEKSVRPSTVPRYVRLYALAAVQRERRAEATHRAAHLRALREEVDLRATSVHRGHHANRVFERNYFVKRRPSEEVEEEPRARSPEARRVASAPTPTRTADRARAREERCEACRERSQSPPLSATRAPVRSPTRQRSSVAEPPPRSPERVSAADAFVVPAPQTPPPAPVEEAAASPGVELSSVASFVGSERPHRPRSLSRGDRTSWRVRADAGTATTAQLAPRQRPAGSTPRQLDASAFGDTVAEE